jgi:hypothetical protein
MNEHTPSYVVPPELRAASPWKDIAALDLDAEGWAQHPALFDLADKSARLENAQRLALHKAVERGRYLAQPGLIDLCRSWLRRVQARLRGEP